jgi:hypothetical protein
MKLSFWLAFVLFTVNAIAATVPAEIPATAAENQQRLNAQLSPGVRDWVNWQAVQTRARPDASADVVRAAVKHLSH